MAKEFFKRANEEQKARQRRIAINQINRHGTNMFFQAIESAKIDEVEKLYEEGAKLDIRTTSRGTLSSMTVNIPYGTGATPLHAACLLGSPDIVAFLLARGADVRAKDDEGHTPLDYAILSHSYYEQDYERKQTGRFTFSSTVEKAQAKVEDYEKVILQLQRRGAKPGMFALPDKFKADKPATPHRPPSL
jgi:hypothetical protein